MPTRTVFLALLVTLLLGGGTLWFLASRTSGGADSAAVVPVGEKVLVFDPAQVTHIGVQRGSDQGEMLTRDRAGAWNVIRRDAPARPWPVAPERIAGLLRLAQQLRAVAEPGDALAALKPGDTTTLELRGTNRTLATLEISTRALAGQALAFASQPGAEGATVRRAAMISDELPRALQASALAWRQTLLFPTVLRDAVSITLNAASPDAGNGSMRTLTISKLNGRWRMTAPVAAPADQAAAARLLGTLQRLEAVSFVEDGSRAVRPAIPAWVAAPMASATIELESAPQEGAAAATHTATLKLGPLADAAARTLFATNDEGRTVVTVSAEPLAGLSVDAEKMIAGQALTISALDVGQLILTRSGSAEARAFKRVPEGWVELRAGTEDVLLDPARGAEVGAALKQLCETAAAGVKIQAPPGYRAVGTIALQTAPGEPLDQIEVGTIEGAGIALRTPALPSRAEVWRTYTDASALVQRAFGLASVEAGAPKPGPVNPGAGPLPPDVKK